uniref:Serine/threonine-protein kinase H1 homolog n=1 Tax=Hirondellea gigas TaxID=1518452 RepID=A0A2P2HYU1_9CRUS
MGCKHSKTIQTYPGANINTVLRTSNSAINTKHNNDLNVADKIKQTRKARTKSGKSTKYDSKITAKYEIKALLGKGQFTKVVRVQNRLSKKPFALKVLEKAEGLETLECEISVLRRVRHPQIIKLIEVFVVEQKRKSVTSGVVLELMTGGDIFDRLFDTGTYCERDAVKVLKQVLEGVEYLHAIGITHRDIKPNNVLYYQPGKESRVVITDFGMAHIRRSASDVLMNEVCGTPEYLAPEVVSRQQYTQAVDVWAVGVMAFIILRGDFPFSLTDRLALFRAIARADYSLDDQVWETKSEECRQFVRSLLSRDGGTRPTATEALQHTWLLTRHPSQHKCRAQGERSWSSSSSGSSVHSLQQLRSSSAGRRLLDPSQKHDPVSTYYQCPASAHHGSKHRRSRRHLHSVS